MNFESRSPSPKRIKLESGSPEPAKKEKHPEEEVPDDLDEDHCSICLQPHIDRTVIPTCSHEFCFDCLMIWTEQSRRCPLCSQTIGDHVIHNVRSRYDYQKHYLTPLRSSPPLRSRPPVTARNRRRIPREVRERSRREREEREEADRFDRAVAKRKWVYKHDLYAKHIASNSYTRYRPYPTPAQFAASQELISRTTSFLRRELLVWPNLDIEFLTTFIISLMKAIDIRSESAVKLLAEFLDMDTPYVEGRRHVNAEHFAHEVYSYVRSPYRDLFIYDDVVQYENPREASPPPQGGPRRRNERWRQSSSSSSHSRSPPPRRHRSTSHSRGRRRSRSKSRSPPWSPSGRRYSREPSSKLETGRSGRGKRGRRSRSRDRDKYDMEGRERGPRLGNRASQRGSSVERYPFGHNESDNIRRSPNDQPHANEGKGKGKERAQNDAGGYDQQQPRSETSGLAEPASHNIERPDSMKANGSGGSGSSVDKQVKADHYGIGISDIGGHSENFIKPDEMSNGMVTGILDATDCNVRIDSTSEVNTRGPRSAPKMRNRNLLQSVQAHLASHSRVRLDEQGARSKSVVSLPKIASTPHSSLTNRDVPAEKPSLLSRLSDVYTGVGSPEQAGIHVANPTPGQAPTEIIDLEKQLMETNDERLKSRPQSTLSSAVSSSSMVAIDTSTSSNLDVGTFGHGRLPQPREELCDARQTPKDTRASSPPRTPSVGQASTATGSDNSASFARQDTIGDNTTPDISLGYSNSLVTDLADAGIPDSRTKLLERLKEEKKKVQKGHDGSRDSNGAGDGGSPTAVHDTPSDDSKAMEAKLRTRAHLRVRLASEKRSCIGSDSPNT